MYRLSFFSFLLVFYACLVVGLYAVVSGSGSFECAGVVDEPSFVIVAVAKYAGLASLPFDFFRSLADEFIGVE